MQVKQMTWTARQHKRCQLALYYIASFSVFSGKQWWGFFGYISLADSFSDKPQLLFLSIHVIISQLNYWKPPTKFPIMSPVVATYKMIIRNINHTKSVLFCRRFSIDFNRYSYVVKFGGHIICTYFGQVHVNFFTVYSWNSIMN